MTPADHRPDGWEDVGREVLDQLLAERRDSADEALRGLEAAVRDGTLTREDLLAARQAVNRLLWTVEDYVAPVTEDAAPYDGDPYSIPTWYHARALDVDLDDVNELRQRQEDEDR